VPALGSGSQWTRTSPLDVLLICNDSDRSYTFEGKRYSPIIDSLGDICRNHGLRVGTVANRWSSILGDAGHGAPASMARSLLAVRAMSPLSAERREAREVALWSRLLDRAAPRIVLAIQPDRALCRAGKYAGVPVFDVQHGVISTTTGSSFYRRDVQRKDWAADYPDGVLCWDRASLIELQKGGVQREHDMVLGHPWLSRFRQRRKGDSLVSAEEERLEDIPDDRQRVLLTLQYGQKQFAGDYVPNGVLAPALQEVMEGENPERFWMVRLHPSQMAGLDDGLARRFLTEHFGHRGDVEWERSSSVALPLLLSSAAVHLTHYSAVAKEAALLGVPTGAVDPHLAEGGSRRAYFDSEIESGALVHLPLDAREIDHFLRRFGSLGAAGLTSDEDGADLERRLLDLVGAMSG
jgi:hypothetical protein